LRACARFSPYKHVGLSAGDLDHLTPDFPHNRRLAHYVVYCEQFPGNLTPGPGSTGVLSAFLVAELLAEVGNSFGHFLDAGDVRGKLTSPYDLISVGDRVSGVDGGNCLTLVVGDRLLLSYLRNPAP